MKLRTIIALTISLSTSTTHVMQPNVNNHSYKPGFAEGAFYVAGFTSVAYGLEDLQQAKNLSRALNIDPEHASYDSDAKQIAKNLEAQGITRILLGLTAMTSAFIYTYLQSNLNTEK